MKVTCMLALAMLLGPAFLAAGGQTKKKVPVHFTCTCSDTLGSRYATAFRDLLASSPRYEAVSTDVNGKGDSATYNFGLKVVSLDPTRTKAGETTVLSVALVMGHVYISNLVQSCTDELKCAKDTLASLDEDVTALQDQ